MYIYLYFQVVLTLSHLLGVMDVNDMDLLGPVISSRHELLVKHVDRYKQIRSSSRKPTGQFVPRIKNKNCDGLILEYCGLLYKSRQPFRKIVPLHFLIEGVLSKGTGEHLRELQNLNLTDSQSAVLTLIQDIFTPTEGKGY